jgi:hypothetical protein
MLAVMLALNPTGKFETEAVIGLVAETGTVLTTVAETNTVPMLSVLIALRFVPSEPRIKEPVLLEMIAEPVPYPVTPPPDPVLTVSVPVTQTGRPAVLVTNSGMLAVISTFPPPDPPADVTVPVTQIGAAAVDVTGTVPTTLALSQTFDPVMFTLPGKVVGQLATLAVIGFVAETGRVMEPVILALKPTGKLAIDAVTGLVALTGSVILAVMLLLNPV